MHLLIPLLLVAAVTSPSFSSAPGTPVQQVPGFVHPGAPAPAPPPATPPSVADQLGQIANALHSLNLTTGGGVNGPLGRNCVEARERMRWSEMPCSPDHLPPLPPVNVEEPYGVN